ncbi:MAG: phenylalanine--tRNA ligase beta subunit-related protein [Thalassobaculum sp.]|uniref:B3/B4 domain-containing protein n=1 Tax=Thalassobaculum sp. TaxID=2022740 RepID=UPI0032ED77C8
MPAFAPTVSPAVQALRPDFRAVSVRVTGGRNMLAEPEAAVMLQAAVAGVAEGPAWADEHLAAWAEAYRAFGARPNRTPCSAEALRKRALKQGSLPAINAVVDVYNALSLRYAVPVGGEDMAGYAGSPRLIVADGSEKFETTADGQPAVEAPDLGEVVWRDDAGVTCRRWNWRQGPRTRLTEDSTALWFVFERLDPMPLSAAEEAAGELVDYLRRLAPGLQADVTVLG